MFFVGDLGDHITYVQRIGQETGNDFDEEPAVTGEIVEKNIIAFVAPHKIVNEIVGDKLHIPDEFRKFFLISENEVDFIETDNGTGREIDFDAVLFDDGRPLQVIELDIVVIIVVFKSDYLGMGMMVLFASVMQK